MTSLSFPIQNLKISPTFDVPSSLYNCLSQVWQYSYEELYEDNTENSITLEDAIDRVLDSLADNDITGSHRRYIWMALILANSVEPTIKSYLPNDTRTKQIFQSVQDRLQTPKSSSQFNAEYLISELFPQVSLGNQAIDEAFDVFQNLLRVLDRDRAKEALTEMLEDCLEGYAIFPGSQERRDLFNWWLLEVVPASWCLEIPNAIYTIQGYEVCIKSYKDPLKFRLFGRASVLTK
ncbi:MULTISPECIES: hypothetical protein [Spirulina sp. CCY15215]|uniref:hypothetical protein n=1 Tax=Spirulina sp. CCY15215 TaxID=2767591 RepID=UPI00194E9401|nr:hypothetical protein [Spirulina major]